jgi:putative membrane protein
MELQTQAASANLGKGVRMMAKRATKSKFLLSKLLLFVGGALLSGALLVAQYPPSGMPGGGGGSQQPTPGTAPGYPRGAQPMPGSDANGYPDTRPSGIDQAFIRQMFESDAAEVQFGQLAQEKSQSDDVRSFAQKTVENRKRLDDQLAPLAKRVDAGEPKGPGKKDKQEIAKLQSLSGAQFDEEYIRVVEKGHEKDVKSMKQAASSAQDPGVQAAAESDAPVIEQHLQVIQKIAQTHNVQIDESKK